MRSYYRTAMTTPARIEANRRNALKSTGPTTALGKALSSRNALRHGFRSRSVLLPTEDPAEYFAFLDRLCAEFPPTSPSREAFLDQMAGAYWKLGRLQRIENGIYGIRSQKDDLGSIFSEAFSSSDPEPEPEPPPPGSEEALGAAYLRDSNGSRAFISLSHYEARLERSFLRANTKLSSRGRDSGRPLPPAQIRTSGFPAYGSYLG
jgi:hypothetical protein